MPGEQIKAKTWRQDDDGHLVHDGDCSFWDRRVCTCGLLHQLRPMTDRALELMPDFYKQDGAQHLITDWLLGSDIVTQANAMMARPERELTPEEEKEFNALMRKVGFIEPKEEDDGRPEEEGHH